MLGAIATHAFLLRPILARRTPVLVPRFALPTRRDVDWRLVGGEALFGIGWGLAGFCPGPAVTSLAGGRPEPLFFVAAMMAGMALHQLLLPPSTQTPAVAEAPSVRAAVPGDARASRSSAYAEPRLSPGARHTASESIDRDHTVKRKETHP